MYAGPAFQYAKAVGDEEKVSSDEHWWSLAGLVATFSGFVFYLFMMVKQSGSELNEQKTDLTIAKYLTHGSDITLTGAGGSSAFVESASIPHCHN